MLGDSRMRKLVIRIIEKINDIYIIYLEKRYYATKQKINNILIKLIEKNMMHY